MMFDANNTSGMAALFMLLKEKNFEHYTYTKNSDGTWNQFDYNGAIVRDDLPDGDYENSVYELVDYTNMAKNFIDAMNDLHRRLSYVPVGKSSHETLLQATDAAIAFGMTAIENMNCVDGVWRGTGVISKTKTAFWIDANGLHVCDTMFQCYETGKAFYSNLREFFADVYLILSKRTPEGGRLGLVINILGYDVFFAKISEAINSPFV